MIQITAYSFFIVVVRLSYWLSFVNSTAVAAATAVAATAAVVVATAAAASGSTVFVLCSRAGCFLQDELAQACLDDRVVLLRGELQRWKANAYSVSTESRQRPSAVVEVAAADTGSRANRD